MYSPCAPEFGWKDIDEKPVISHNQLFKVHIIWEYPWAWSLGTNGCKFISSHVTGIISAVAFNFIVHEPSEIIECTRDKSLFSNLFIYLKISCSVWYLLNTSWDRKSDCLFNVEDIWWLISSILFKLISKALSDTSEKILSISNTWDALVVSSKDIPIWSVSKYLKFILLFSANFLIAFLLSEETLIFNVSK